MEDAPTTQRISIVRRTHINAIGLCFIDYLLGLGQY